MDIRQWESQIFISPGPSDTRRKPCAAINYGFIFQPAIKPTERTSKRYFQPFT